MIEKSISFIQLHINIIPQNNPARCIVLAKIMNQRPHMYSNAKCRPPLHIYELFTRKSNTCI